MGVWLGVDVGAERKGFDVALVDESGLLHHDSGMSAAQVTALASVSSPVLVGIDAPCACAPAGEASRESERRLARSVCAIRYTPDEERVRAGAYYAWIVNGLHLFASLRAEGRECIEVFPTASWTRWHGAREGRPRAAWTTGALAALGLAGVPARTGQDLRDAIAAAVTARQHSAGATETFGGEIVVPAGAWRTAAQRRADGVMIEGATIADLAAVVREGEAFWGERETAHLHHPMLIHEFGRTALVARAPGGEIAGYLFGFVTVDRRVAYAHLVAVREGRRGSGLARALYGRFEEIARELGAVSLKAYTSPQNERSIAVQRALGMSAEEIADYAGPGESRVVFRRSLR